MFHFWNVQRDRVRERNILRLRQNVICFMLLSYFDHAKCMIEMNAGEKSDQEHTSVAKVSSLLRGGKVAASKRSNQQDTFWISVWCIVALPCRRLSWDA